MSEAPAHARLDPEALLRALTSPTSPNGNGRDTIDMEIDTRFEQLFGAAADSPPPPPEALLAEATMAAQAAIKSIPTDDSVTTLERLVEVQVKALKAVNDGTERQVEAATKLLKELRQERFKQHKEGF